MSQFIVSSIRVSAVAADSVADIPVFSCSYLLFKSWKDAISSFCLSCYSCNRCPDRRGF